MFIDLIAFAVQYVPIGTGAVGSVFPAGFGSNFRIMVGSASGPGSTFKAFLGSTRVRVPLSNKIQVRVGSAQHIYRSLRVRVRIFGPVKTSSLRPLGNSLDTEHPWNNLPRLELCAAGCQSTLYFMSLKLEMKKYETKD